MITSELRIISLKLKLMFQFMIQVYENRREGHLFQTGPPNLQHMICHVPSLSTARVHGIWKPGIEDGGELPH